MRLELICVINSKSFHNNKWRKRDNFPSSDTMPINTSRCHKSPGPAETPPRPQKLASYPLQNARRDALWFSVTVQSWSKPLQRTESRLRDAKVWGATLQINIYYEGTKPTPGLRLHLSAVSFFLRPQLWNGTCEVALISKAVASPFSYRYKKKNPKRCERATSGLALQNLAYIGSWIFDHRGAFM